MKEAISVRIDRELLRKLGIKEGDNKSEKIRRVLEEYVELKAEVERLRKVEGEMEEIKRSIQELEGRYRELRVSFESFRREYRGVVEQGLRGVLEEYVSKRIKVALDMFWLVFFIVSGALFIVMLIKTFPELVRVLKAMF